MTERRDPLYDFGAELALIPSGRWVHARLFGEQDVYRQTFERLPRITAYPYFDTHDRPADVSVREWRTRGRQWARVLPGTAAEAGWIVPLTPHDWFVRPDDGALLSLGPSRRHRLHVLALRQVSLEWLTAHWTADNPQKGILAWWDYVGTPAGKATVDERAALLGPAR